MKTTLSIILQLSPSKLFVDLEAVAKNILDGLDFILYTGHVKCSVFMDGPTLEMMRKVARPLSFGKLRDGVRNGSLEILGGGYYDSMMPLFPEELQEIQLNAHRKALKDVFGIEPQGYYNSSLVWEMDMTSTLESCGFDYSLVSESAIQDALGRTTPVSGWYTLEDKGALMRIVPVADTLSKAFEKDDLNWKSIADSYCRDGKSAVVILNLPSDPSEIPGFFERLDDFVETNEIQTLPVSYIVNQLQCEGPISYLVSAGRKNGLQTSSRTCRDVLVRRSEINYLQKFLLNLFHMGHNSLEGKYFERFCQKLMPAMSPVYYRDLDNDEGMQSLRVREKSYKDILRGSKALDDLMEFSGLRLKVCDYMLKGSKQIWMENSEISCLLDFYAGGVLRSLNYKPSMVNLVNTWRDDGEASFAFADCLLPNVDVSADQIDTALSGRENMLAEPYEYQIKRGEKQAEIQLLEEQGFDIGDKKGVFHVAKDFALKNDSSEIEVSYGVTNSTYIEAKCFFGTIFELGMLDKSMNVGLFIDEERIKWDKKSPVIYPEANIVEIKDAELNCTVRIKFDVPASVFVGSVFGASATAAPEVFQGIRIFPFWRMALNVMDEKKFKISVSVTKG